MTITQHTPGPWFHSFDSFSHPYHHCIVAKDGLHTQVVAVLSPDIKPEEREANARLIAAAPALLEAMEQAIKDLEDMSSNHYAEGYRRVIAGNLRAAIAQVTKEETTP